MEKINWTQPDPNREHYYAKTGKFQFWMTKYPDNPAYPNAPIFWAVSVKVQETDIISLHICHDLANHRPDLFPKTRAEAESSAINFYERLLSLIRANNHK